MKKLVFLSLSFSAFFSHAQLNTNTLLPYGNVGVGTLFPSAKLQVNGSTLLQGLTATGNTLLSNTKITGTVEVPGMQLTSSAILDLQFVLRDPVTGVLKSASLNQVIGGIYGPPPISCGPIYRAAPTWLNGQDKIYSNCPNVNVGVGTAFPTFPLHVVGKGYFSNDVEIGSSLQVGDPSLTTGNGTSLGVYCTAGTAIKVRYNQPTATIFQATNSDGSYTPFLMRGNGQIIVHNGIQKIMQLDPDGTLFARKIKVDMVAWPDYVFADNYKLMSIYDVESFILAHKHLPNIPSANEIETEGIDLACMNKLLMEKTEEMTLYIIQQQHQNDVQQMQIDVQQKQIDELKAQMELLLKKD